MLTDPVLCHLQQGSGQEQGGFFRVRVRGSTPTVPSPTMHPWVPWLSLRPLQKAALAM